MIDRALPSSPARRPRPPFVEALVFAASIVAALVTWYVVASGPRFLGGAGTERGGAQLLTPVVVTLLLLANLAPAIALLVLVGRRIARARARRGGIGGDGGLHVRLVSLFSLVASIPTLLVVVFASLLFQAGVQFWFSDRAKSTLEGASSVVNASYRREEARVLVQNETMAKDLAEALAQAPYDDPRFVDFFGQQLLYRELSEGIIFRIGPRGDVQSLVLWNPRDRPLERFIGAPTIAALRAGRKSVPVASPSGIGGVTKLPFGRDNFVYGAKFDADFDKQIRTARAVSSDYRALAGRSRSLQLRFNAALLVISLLIVGGAVWIALLVADRLVRPIGALVSAARRVTGGDLSVRVEGPHARDEVGTLGEAFNAMTQQLEVQTTDLRTANGESERRRALIETVLTGVSAGVVAVARDGSIRLMNGSAAALLATGAASPVGRRLRDVSPELADLAEAGNRDAVVEIQAEGEPRTLAVKVARDDNGHVLTFDDITQQLTDQRRAAWSDVARRVAHEIKNPLTPIQLAAERLRRRYGPQITNDPATFVKLTDTIVRQVGDLRRMVDEFSSFARMPKPEFAPASLVDIAREALFLHEVANPRIAFALTADDDIAPIVCDRRQLSQALTNIVKNAVEAVEAREGGEGRIEIEVARNEALLTLTVADTGVGLPANRERIVEPYVTTRARGTGLGLAIVSKIVEEHFATMTFNDRPGGGTIVTLTFDRERLAQVAGEASPLADRV